VSSTLGYTVTAKSNRPTVCDYDSEDARVTASASVSTTLIEEGNGGFAGSKSGTLAVIPGTPKAPTGIGDEAFVVSNKQGDQIRPRCGAGVRQRAASDGEPDRRSPRGRRCACGEAPAPRGLEALSLPLPLVLQALARRVARAVAGRRHGDYGAGTEHAVRGSFRVAT